MGIDMALLEGHRSYRDPASGISEEFLQPVLGGGRTIAVITRPPGTPNRVGWVICHSFGREQIVLSQMEAFGARALAAVGFTVLRFHSLGYGDSEGRMRDISLTSHVASASDALDLMASEPGIDQIGLLGTRFGGTVAAMVAERKQTSALALWAPIVGGASFMREFLRMQLSFEVMGEAQSLTEGHNPLHSPAEPKRPKLRDRLSTEGWVDVQGFLLTRETYEQISGIDLTRELGSFKGQSLVVSITRTGNKNQELEKLVERLNSIGGQCTHEAVSSRIAPELGRRHFMPAGVGEKTDVQVDLSGALSNLTASWASRFRDQSPTD